MGRAWDECVERFRSIERALDEEIERAHLGLRDVPGTISDVSDRAGQNVVVSAPSFTWAHEIEFVLGEDGTATLRSIVYYPHFTKREIPCVSLLSTGSVSGDEFFEDARMIRIEDLVRVGLERILRELLSAATLSYCAWLEHPDPRPRRVPDDVA